MKSTIKCRHDCHFRTENCHASCDRYKKECEEWQKTKEAIKKDRRNQIGFFDRFRYWR